MNFAMIGGKVWTFLKEIPIWVWIVFVAFITLKWVEADNFKKGQDAKADEIKQKQAEVKAAVTERVSEIVSEERSSADAAIEARDHSPSFPHSDGVPDPLQRVIFRDT